MAISEKDVRHVALLSRLELAPGEAEKYAGELARIFTHIEKLADVNADGVPPTTHPMAMSNVFREDEVRPSLPVERALANAPEQEDNCFRVPQIL